MVLRDSGTAGAGNGLVLASEAGPGLKESEMTGSLRHLHHVGKSHFCH